MTVLPNLAAVTRSVDRTLAAYDDAVALPWPSAPQAAVFDASGEVLAASSIAAVAGFTATLAAIRGFFGDAWQAGDAAITNDQDAGAATACEMTAIVPVWGADKAAPVLWAAVRAFVPDCGGWEIGGYSPQAVDRWAEGARFEAAKVALAGRVRREATDMLMLNSRTPKLMLRCVRALVDAANGLGMAVRDEIAASGEADRAALADALLASELERFDRAALRLDRRAAKGSADIRTPFADLALDPIEVAILPGNEGIAVAISAPPLAPRPVNLAPVAAEDIVAAAVGGALGLGGFRTGALRRRLRIEAPVPSLAAAPLPAPVCLGRATTGAAVFAATLAALADAGIESDRAALWRSYRATHDDGALDLESGKITPARAAAIRAREAEEAKA